MRTDKAAECILAAEHPSGPGNLCYEEKNTGKSFCESRLYSCTVEQQQTHTEFTLKSVLF